MVPKNSEMYVPSGRCTIGRVIFPVTSPPEPSLTAKKERQTTAPTSLPQQDNDRQRFIITPLCPRCHDKLVPERGVFCQHCGAELPDELGVHKEIVVAIKVADYKKLAVHVKQRVCLAWSHFVKGREVQKVSGLGQNIFVIAVVDEMRTSTVAQEKRLDDLLKETGIGRTSVDPYEVKQAHAMLDTERNKPDESA